jgi:hypothetical protein
MPFGLQNAGATYQRMMNKVYDKSLLGDILEDDMIVKSQQEVDHAAHLRRVFEQTRKYNMRLNPEKCTFGVQTGKFLGFYLTERGIEANPDKCRAFTKLPTPYSKKCIQTLNGILTALSRFVAKSAQHALPFFKLLRKETKFEWTDECETALKHLKETLSVPPVLSRPDQGEILYLYLSVSSDVVSAVLIRETAEGQKLVYFTSKALLGPKTRYQRIEKVALALLTAARRLRQYFLAHTVVVRTDQPIRQILGRPDVAGRIMKWSLKLSEFDIHYESRKALKAQVFSHTKEGHLQKYVQLVLEMMKEFENVEVIHVPREQNNRADILSKLASTRNANGNKTVIQEVLSEPSIQDKGTLHLEVNAIIGMEDWTHISIHREW